MLFRLTPLGVSDRDHEATPSSPVLRKWEFTTSELLAPSHRLTPSAKVLRKRLPVMTRPLGPGRGYTPAQYPTWVCSTQMFSMREPVLPAALVNPSLSGN